MNIIDTATPITSHISCLKENGYSTVIRYYTRYRGNPKLLKVQEAEAILRAGLSLAIVYQDYNNSPRNFSRRNGYQAGQFAYKYARDEIGQPEYSAIYFAVDYDASQEELNANISEYFKGVQAAFEDLAEGEEPLYRIGVYGSGLTCSTLLAQNLVTFTWLSMSTGHRGYDNFEASNHWHLKQLYPSTTACGIAVDENVSNSDFGAFSFASEVTGNVSGTDTISEKKNDLENTGTPQKRYEVVARRGLRLRSGPGLDFDTLEVLPVSTKLYVTNWSGEWAEVDLEGDFLIDGWVFGRFIRAI
ncbi:MAG: glycoside hydrolase domain-containing protein [Synechococcus sp.]